MAKGARLILGIASLCWQSTHVVGQEDMAEIFPLSGGIDDGVTATIKFSGLQENAKIEFLQPDRTVVFAWTFEADKQICSRTSAISGDPESWGGWPENFDINSENTIKFEKRKHEFAISINDMRYPWFDFRHRHAHSVRITHVRVHPGVVDPEVILARPECTTPCAATECMLAGGASACPEGQTCYATKRSDDRLVASSCTADNLTTPDGSMHCCDGLPLTIDLLPAAVGTYEAIISDTGLLERVCKAFNVASCPTAHAGYKAEIKASSNDTYSIFVPHALSEQLQDPYDIPANTMFDIPAFALSKASPVQRRYVKTTGGVLDEDTGAAVDGTTAVVWKVVADSDAANVGIEKGWYVGLVRHHLSNTVKRWHQWGRRVQETIDAREIELLLVDEFTVPEGCVDEPFVDELNDTCAEYEAGQYCDIHGGSTEEGRARWNTGGYSSWPRNTAPDAPTYFRGYFQCCTCGGGAFPAPPEAPSNSTGFFFQ